MTSPVDDLPVEVRRENWGWFGEPWPSGVCYDDDGRLLEEMRKSFPDGESCLWCEEIFRPGDSGQAIPHGGSADGFRIRHSHKECLLRQVVGGLAHLEGRCTCYGGDGRRPEEMSRREEAILVWAHWTQRGPSRLLDL